MEPPTTITLSKAWLEHLLNCLANQYFIQELELPDQIINQQIINAVWSDGMAVLNGIKNCAWESPIPPILPSQNNEKKLWSPPQNARRAIWTDPCVSNGNPKYEGWAWLHKPFGTKGGWERMNHFFRADEREDDSVSWICEDDLVFLD